MIDADKLRKLIGEVSLQRVADDLVKLARPAIRIKPRRVEDEANLPLGGSKLGGSPDLPPGFEWYEWKGKPLTFIAQFRLSEVAPFNADGVLPPQGMLYFFYEADSQPWGPDLNDLGSSRVLYLADETQPLERFPHPTGEGGLYRRQIEALFPHAISFSQQVTLPDPESADAEALHLSQDERYHCWDLLNLLDEDDKDEPLHQLLGHPAQIQGDMQLECQLATNGLHYDYDNPRVKALEPGARDWRLLLQIDSVGKTLGVYWGDVGRIYYWIHAQALQARDFDNGCLILQCY